MSERDHLLHSDIPYSKKVSPLQVLLAALILLELVYRVPAVLISASARNSKIDSFIFFGAYDPITVTIVGVSISLLGYFAFVCGQVLINRRIMRITTYERPQFRIKINFFFTIATIMLCGAGVLGIREVGIVEIFLQISAKRDIVGDDGSPLKYVLFRLAMAIHIPAFILLAYCFSKPTPLRILSFLIVTLFLIGFAAIFSQRQIVLLAFLEFFYVAVVFGNVNRRTTIIIVSSVVAFLFVVTVSRGGSNDLSYWEAFQLFNEKIVTSRYFLDFTRHGTIWLWQYDEGIQPTLVLGSFFKLFYPLTMTPKEFGHDVASYVYWKYNPGGVTTGAVLDSVIQFGFFIGFFFITIFGAYFAWLERRVVRQGFSIISIFLLCKVLVFLNTGVDSFIFASVVELPLVLFFMSTTKKYRVATGEPHA